MIKKIAIGGLVLVLLAGGFALYSFWSTAQKQTEYIVRTNMTLLRQQLFSDNHTQIVDFQDIEPAFHYGWPAVRIKKPRLILQYYNTQYVFQTDEVIIAGDYSEKPELELIVPKTATLKREKKSTLLLTFPDDISISLRAYPDSEPNLRTYYLSQTRVQLPKEFSIGIAADGQAKEAVGINIQLFPQNIWIPIRYRFYQPLTRFIEQVNRRGDVTAS